METKKNENINVPRVPVPSFSELLLPLQFGFGCSCVALVAPNLADTEASKKYELVKPSPTISNPLGSFIGSSSTSGERKIIMKNDNGAIEK